MRKRLLYPKVDLFFSSLLALMVIGAAWTGAREGWFLTRAGHARGTVVSVKTSFQQGRVSKGYDKYRPTISFKDAAGRPWTFESGRFGLEGGRVGAILPVVYDPGDPGSAQIESFWGKWDPTFTFAYAGFFALLLRWLFRQATVRPVDPLNPAAP